jgi:hypothetical protein
MRTVGLSIALIVMLINTSRLSISYSAFITTGFGLGLMGAILWQLTRDVGTIALITYGINAAAVSVILLFGLRHWFKRRDRHSNRDLPIYKAYIQAFDLWAVLLSTPILFFQTYLALIVFSDFSNFNVIVFWNQDITSELFANLFLSSGLITAGLVYRAWQEPVFWTEWGIAWGMELLVSGAIALTNGSAIELAIANLGLGLMTQLLGDWWMRRTGQIRYPLSWDVVPLIYGGMGSLLRLGSFSDFTGLFTLSTSLVGIGIGRRVPEHFIFKLLTYISITGATFSAYELLFYQMISANTGGSWGDGMVILGVLGCAIAYIYQIFARWIMPYLKFSSREINTSAHLHWLASTVLLVGGSLFSPTSTGGTVGVGLAIALTIYALSQGRKSDATAELWVYLGIGMGIVALFYQFAYASPNPWLNQTILIPYSGAIACGFATTFFLIPWTSWGWAPRPWFRSALVLPLLFVSIFAKAIAIPCLLIVAIFYSIRAFYARQIRLTYLTVWLLAWICFRFISLLLFSLFPYLFSYTCTICFSILYFCQVEPILQDFEFRSVRHIIRSLATGSLCAIAFFCSIFDVQIALITWGLSLAFVIAGLIMRVRAFLSIGTITFVLLVLNQAVLLVSRYGFLLWAIGIVAGIGFITIAANFEVRRDRILAIARNILNELEAWA